MATFPPSRRLLRDIHELQSKPNHDTTLHIPSDEDITTGCLTLVAPVYGSIHLTINFPTDYPLKPPVIRMDSKVTHPNVKEAGHVCASILDTEMDYTSAYTLKGIAIQLLSFFSSDRIQQAGGEFAFTLDYFRALHLEENANAPVYECDRGPFGAAADITDADKPDGSSFPDSATSSTPLLVGTGPRPSLQRSKLPDEIILPIFSFLESEDLISFAKIWPKISELIAKFNIMQMRELQCFCLTESYMTAKLGIGIAVRYEEKGNMPLISSEFDFLSEEDYNLGVRRSVQGIPFKYWLPVPISESHYTRITPSVDPALLIIAQGGGYSPLTPTQVLFRLLNDIMIKLCKETDSSKHTYRSPIYPYEEHASSTLHHASEKV